MTIYSYRGKLIQASTPEEAIKKYYQSPKKNTFGIPITNQTVKNESKLPTLQNN